MKGWFVSDSFDDDVLSSIEDMMLTTNMMLVLVVLSLTVPHTEGSLTLDSWLWANAPEYHEMYIASSSIDTLSGTHLGLLDCVMACFNHPKCLTFYARNSSGIFECELKDRIFTNYEMTMFSVTEAGMSYYKISPSCPGFMATYTINKASRQCLDLVYMTLSYSNAQGVCMEYGALATLDTSDKIEAAVDLLLDNTGHINREFWVGASWGGSFYKWDSTGQELDPTFISSTSDLTEDCIAVRYNSVRNTMEAFDKNCNSDLEVIFCDKII